MDLQDSAASGQMTGQALPLLIVNGGKAPHTADEIKKIIEAYIADLHQK